MTTEPTPNAPLDPDVLATLERLVAFDTTSRDSNLALINHVAERLDAKAAKVEILPNSTGDKANLLIRLGPEAPGGIVLSGHTDCVPVDGQPWMTDPFVVRRDGTRLVGRGVTDMKGFIATAIVAAERADLGKLTRPVWLACSYDEELGCLGAPEMIAHLVASGATPEAAIIGEPTNLIPTVAHKGVRSVEVVVTGRDGHSSQPHLAANANVAAARLIAHLDDVAGRLRDDADEHDEAFDPPFTSVNVGILRGGTAINIVAREASFTFEYRPLPHHQDLDLAADLAAYATEQILPGLQATAPESTITVTARSSSPGLAADPTSPALALVRRLAGRLTAPISDETATVPFGTEAGQFQQAGIPAIVFGPGSIEQAHKPNEWIETDQLVRATALSAAAFNDAMAR